MKKQSKAFQAVLLSAFFFAACTSIPAVETPEEQVPVVETSEVESTLVYPIETFSTNITKKHFGTYVTPQDSPVQPERFRGYHLGVDIEAGDQEGDVWVRSIADGKILQIRDVDGYGGIVVIQYQIEGQDLVALYGHLDLKSVTVKVGDSVSLGQSFAFLGDGYSEETDGERKHLHFSLRPGTTVNLGGYTQTEAGLGDWIDPEEFFAQFPI